MVVVGEAAAQEPAETVRVAAAEWEERLDASVAATWVAAWPAVAVVVALELWAGLAMVATVAAEAD